MTDVFKNKINLVNAELDAALAKEIYLYMRDNFLDESEAFNIGGYKPSYCRKVINEVKSILNQAIALIQANPDITAVALKAGISVTLLDLDEIGADLIKLFPYRKADRTFIEFKEAYAQ